MDVFEIGREIQDLRCRIERVEAGVDGPHARSRAHLTGTLARPGEAGVHPGKPPVHWNHHVSQIPTFVNGLLGLPPHLKLDLAESKTWSCVPEPLIFYVNWNAGGTDEYFRLSDQVFSVISVTDPNTDVVSAYFSYSAHMKASGKGYSAYSVDGVLFGGYEGETMSLTLKDSGGAALFSYNGFRFSVNCGDDLQLINMYSFPAGPFDLVSGASWQMQGSLVGRC